MANANVTLAALCKSLELSAWQENFVHMLYPILCESWKDCVVSLMGWTTSSLSFEVDKPFKTMTNVRLQFRQRQSAEMKKVAGTRNKKNIFLNHPKFSIL